MQMNLNQLRMWIAMQIGVAEIRAIRAPGMTDVGTDIPDVPPDQSTGTVSGDEQRWTRIAADQATNPDGTAPVEVIVKNWTGKSVSDWISPDQVSTWLTGPGAS